MYMKPLGDKPSADQLQVIHDTAVTGMGRKYLVIAFGKGVQACGK
jgi:hypothetical protein